MSIIEDAQRAAAGADAGREGPQDPWQRETHHGSSQEPQEAKKRKGRVFGRGDEGFGGWSKAKAALDRRIFKARREMAEKAGKAVDNVEPPAPWTVHDIRRSVATHMGELGILPHVVEALLNHVSGHKAGVAGIYNRSAYERETKAALVVWADHVRSVVEHCEPTVVTMLRRHS
jgi:hypothetical protein